eukprot:CAMPEP_0185598614 /NCGR_PEP_ID=MMETSP0434-20130131/82119_2 /TAXON_ID=626734 ORGANISM="Favella taraikaensis, Strain Fe Narragansett Bay" /NCGR_SAMPLE_ID=MMETSP0434 /ASSEMBLY_ACC=CAM_ASM_000379 /LENGTH=82 /DNA_ID=CAMNT_0028227669 /DNA_START=421 /DNA_END=669 /DNA_ORIENTATION=-
MVMAHAVTTLAHGLVRIENSAVALEAGEHELLRSLERDSGQGQYHALHLEQGSQIEGLLSLRVRLLKQSHTPLAMVICGETA